MNINYDKIYTVIDSLINGQHQQARQQIKRLTYDERINLIEYLPDGLGDYKRLMVLKTIVKREF
jgi:hypothetical protein